MPYYIHPEIQCNKQYSWCLTNTFTHRKKLPVMKNIIHYQCSCYHPFDVFFVLFIFIHQNNHVTQFVFLLWNRGFIKCFSLEFPLVAILGLLYRYQSTFSIRWNSLKDQGASRWILLTLKRPSDFFFQNVILSSDVIPYNCNIFVRN